MLVGNVSAQDKGSAKTMTEMAPKPSDSPVIKAYKQAHMDMMKSMDVPLTGEPDVDFARNMIPHHQAAISMAKIELQHGKDPELKKMAEKMIADQESEINALKAWLTKHSK
jgi:uncharacterized protein (DUF305 family)